LSKAIRNLNKRKYYCSITRKSPATTKPQKFAPYLTLTLVGVIKNMKKLLFILFICFTIILEIFSGGDKGKDKRKLEQQYRLNLNELPQESNPHDTRLLLGGIKPDREGGFFEQHRVEKKQKISGITFQSIKPKHNL
jgi:hypothetical protein